MFFEIIPAARFEGDAEGYIKRRWVYRQGTPENRGEIICQSPADLDSEESCRRNIAAARKSFAGAKFAKVVTS